MRILVDDFNEIVKQRHKPDYLYQPSGFKIIKEEK